MEGIIVADNVKKYFSFSKGIIKKKVSNVKAVDGVTLNIYKGEILGLVGESGSGKTTMAKLILSLLTPSENGIYFNGVDIFKASVKEQRNMRKRMGVLFQDPASSLNPRLLIP